MPFVRFGRPGLLGTIARTAVIAGTASVTANAVNRRAAQRTEEQQDLDAYQSQQQSATESQAAVRQAEAEAAAAERAAEQYSTVHQTPASGDDDLVSRLGDLAKLRESGALTSAEFEAAKAKLLGS